jgi:hypothetical protein
MAIVKTTSPLWKLPQGLHPQQASFLDAIRLSVQFIDLAHARLHDGLTQLTLSSDRSLQLGPNALMDAWAVIDAVHRLRALVRQLPRYKQRAPSKRLFMDRTQSVDQLRNSFQHLVSEISELTDSDLPVLGAITWVRPVDGQFNCLSINTFIPGQARSIDPSSWVIVPGMVPDRVTQIELWHRDKKANITILHGAVCELVAAIEGELAKLSPDNPAAICDAMASITLELVPRPPGQMCGRGHE